MKVPDNSNTVYDKHAVNIKCKWHQKILIQTTKYGSETRNNDNDESTNNDNDDSTNTDNDDSTNTDNGDSTNNDNDDSANNDNDDSTNNLPVTSIIFLKLHPAFNITSNSK